jgi:hypothetical protein
MELVGLLVVTNKEIWRGDGDCKRINSRTFPA